MIDVAAPYCHQQGGIEREWRELRACLRAWVAERKLPAGWWPYLVHGYCTVRNSTASTRHASPLN